LLPIVQRWTRLVPINGVPASGKSTLAQRYAAEYPLTLVLDMDLVRRMLGGWQDLLAESGLAARRIAVKMARTHLRGGHDVVVPQFRGRVDFVRELAELGADVGRISSTSSCSAARTRPSAASCVAARPRRNRATVTPPPDRAGRWC
jgi:AAA domain